MPDIFSDSLNRGGMFAPYLAAAMSRDRSRACMVADTLAWAVRHGIPLPSALTALPFYRRLPVPVGAVGRLADGLKWVTRPLRPLRAWTNTRWSWNLGRFLHDIEAGMPTSKALHRHCRRHFPRFFLLGMAKAEADGRLDTALPVLARQLRYPAAVAAERRMELQLAGWRMLCTVWVMLFVLTRALPMIDNVYADLTGAPGMPLTPLLQALAVPLLLVFLVLGSVLIGAHVPVIGEQMILHLPGLGRERRRFALAELAGGMSAFLQQGEDLPTAADWCMQSTRSIWLRRRLRRFTAALREGVPWIDAWDRMRVGRPLHNWILRNAAAREDPVAGFEMMAHWLQQEIDLMTRRLNRWVEPVCTLFLAAIVGLIAWQMFNMLTQLILALT